MAHTFAITCTSRQASPRGDKGVFAMYFSQSRWYLVCIKHTNTSGTGKAYVWPAASIRNEDTTLEVVCLSNLVFVNLCYIDPLPRYIPIPFVQCPALFNPITNALESNPFRPSFIDFFANYFSPQSMNLPPKRKRRGNRGKGRLHPKGKAPRRAQRSIDLAETTITIYILKHSPLHRNISRFIPAARKYATVPLFDFRKSKVSRFNRITEGHLLNKQCNPPDSTRLGVASYPQASKPKKSNEPLLVVPAI